MLDKLIKTTDSLNILEKLLDKLEDSSEKIIKNSKQQLVKKLLSSIIKTKLEESRKARGQEKSVDQEESLKLASFSNRGQGYQPSVVTLRQTAINNKLPDSLDEHGQKQGIESRQQITQLPEDPKAKAREKLSVLLDRRTTLLNQLTIKQDKLYDQQSKSGKLIPFNFGVEVAALAGKLANLDKEIAGYRRYLEAA